MVWCARESADFTPMPDGAMQFFNDYGWIHWDGHSKTWHTVTGYELGKAGKAPQTRHPVVTAQLLQQRPGLDPHGLGEDLLDFWEQAPGVGAAPADGAPADAVVQAAAEQAAAQAAAAKVETARTAAVQAATAQAAQAAVIPAAPAQKTAASDQGTTWDTEHKRDEDRADTQHTLENTRWDTQHTLDNTRWDTRHTLENTRWDTQHTLDNTRWDAQHTLDNARWDAYLGLKRSREDTALAVESTLLEAVHGGYIAVAQSSLDRAVQRATYIATAAGAIATLYTAILALRFGNSSHPAFPARGLIPALFIGGAVAFSTWYMAFLRGTTKMTELLPSGLGGSIAETRLMDFMEWTFAGVLARAWSLRLSVISLALGLAFLPIGFVTLSTGVTLGLGVAGAAILLLWVLGEIYVAVMGPPFTRSRDSRDRGPTEGRRPGPGEAHHDAGVAEAFEAWDAWHDDAHGRVPRRRSVRPRPPKLAFEAKPLPKIPTKGFGATGPKSHYGLSDRPEPPQRADSVDPPDPPAVAQGVPPKSPKRSDSVDPPDPPAVAEGDPPKPPGPVARGSRPETVADPAAPVEVEVVVRTEP